MSSNTRRLLLSCGVLLLVACLCAGVLGLGATGLGAFRLANPLPTQTLILVEVPTATLIFPTPTLLPASTPPQATGGKPTATPIPLPIIPLPVEVQNQMDAIQSQVLTYRDLTLKSPVIRDLLTSDQLREKVKTDFFKDYTPADARKDARIYFAFGWLPANFDLLTFEINLQAEEVAGFYDNITKQMVVVSDQGFKGFQRMTYAHEFTHVLQDQNFDIKDGLRYDDKYCKKEGERCNAVQAMLEGDAMMSELTWTTIFSTAQDKKDVQDFYGNLKLPITGAAPLYITDSQMNFPYQTGLEFVQSIFDHGGYQAVNAMFKNPPVDTRQILHPDDYPNVKPVTVKLPDLTTPLGGGYKLLDNGVLGEAGTIFLLSDGIDPLTRLPKNTARQAAMGWSGDAYAVYDNGSSSMPVLVLMTQWDSISDAQQFTSAFKRYGIARWGKSTTTGATTLWSTTGAVASIAQTGQKTTWILAPDGNVLQRITSAIQ